MKTTKITFGTPLVLIACIVTLLTSSLRLSAASGGSDVMPFLNIGVGGRPLRV